jgi:CBS domain-containing protein
MRVSLGALGYWHLVCSKKGRHEQTSNVLTASDRMRTESSCESQRGGACSQVIIMKLNELFTRGVVTASPEEKLSTIAVQMREHNVGTVVIVQDQRPVGIVTDRDLALALGAQGESLHTPVRKVMSQHVLAIPEDTGIYAATSFMRERQVRRLPIVDREDHVVGIVTLDDLLRFLGRELYNLAEGIKPEMKVR